MIAVIQRVSMAEVTVDNKCISNINNGLLILLGVVSSDTEKDSKFLANKIAQFRIFNDDNNKMNLSLKDIEGEALVVSQFTLCADWLKGRRPSFIHAATPEIGEKLYKEFIEDLKSEKINTKEGQFGAMMDVSLINDGPVTFVLDSNLKHSNN